MTAEASNARGEWVLVPRELLDEARNIAMAWTLKGRVPECRKFGQIAQDLDAMLAAAPQPPAEAQPVAKLVNRKDADGGKTTTFIRPTEFGMDLPPGEYPLHLHPPPSAPVGVEDVEVLKRLRAALPDVGLNGWWLGVEVLDRVIDALAQQPAAVDEAMVERAWVAFCEDTGPARAAMRAALTAALATKHQEPES